jgi:glycosyltransferase involved in cell wall biosynthesis
MPQLPTLEPISSQPLSVVLLSYQAAGYVKQVLGGWIRFLEGQGRDYELILVDDGSSDATVERARSMAEQYPHLRVLAQEPSRGEGAALRAGLAEARHPLLFYTRCDPVYRPADLERLLARRTEFWEGLESKGMQPEIDHVHIMGGFRGGQPVPLPWRVVGWLWRAFCRLLLAYCPTPLPGWLGWRGHLGWLVVRIVFGLRTRDVFCPFRLMRRSIFARIPIQSDGPFVHVEILAKANFLGCVLAEELPLAVPAGPIRGRETLWRDGLRVFRKPDFGPVVVPSSEVRDQQSEVRDQQEEHPASDSSTDNR